MTKQLILTASVFAVLAVIFGAFGAHGLKDRLTPNELEVWKTGVSYQFYHVFALLFLACLSNLDPSYTRYSYISFVLGIVLFSGSLFLLSTKTVSGFKWTALMGPITPIGGLFFILGWVFLFIAAYKNN